MMDVLLDVLTWVMRAMCVLVIGFVGWVALAVVLGLVVALVIRARERQVPGCHGRALTEAERQAWDALVKDLAKHP